MSDVFDGDCFFAPCCERASHEGLMFQPIRGLDGPLEGEWGILMGTNSDADLVFGDFSFCPYCGSKLPAMTDETYAKAKAAAKNKPAGKSA